MAFHPVAEPAGSASATTALIQAAIDRCHSDGGGLVALAGGRRFVCGTVHLRSGVELRLESGCVLAASRDQADFQERAFGGEYGGSSGSFLILAEDCQNVAITGPGTIDGDSLAWMKGWRDPEGRFIRDPKDWRPRGIGLYFCGGVRLEQFTMRDIAQWTIHLTGCDDVVCHALTIRNRLDVPNCDGIDPDRCRNVRISDCHIEAGDDGIVLKNTRQFAGRGDCTDIVISNCTIVSTSAGLKIGTESHGDFRRIAMTGCVIRGSHRGLAIQLRDHGTVEDILFANCLIETRHFHGGWWGHGEPVAITAMPRDASTVPGRIRRVRLTGLMLRGENGIVIHGNDRAPIEDLTLNGIDLEIEQRSRWPGGQLDLRPRFGAEHGGSEPHPNPGVLLRHGRNLTIRNLSVRWRGTPQPWWSHAIDAADIAGLSMAGCTGVAGQAGLPAILHEHCT